MRECSVVLEVLSPAQIARLCRPNRPQKTRPKELHVAETIDIESTDHDGKKKISQSKSYRVLTQTYFWFQFIHI